MVAAVINRITEVFRNQKIYDNEIQNETFDNARITIEKLSDYLEFLDVQEIGLSTYNTFLFNFENGNRSILLDIGNKRISYVYYQDVNHIETYKNHFTNPTFWKNLDNSFKKLKNAN